MGMRNLPRQEARPLASLVTSRPGQVSSMAMTQPDDAASMTLLAFSAGEGVSEEAYEGDTLYYLASGEAQVTLPDRTVPLVAGDVLMVPAGTLHAVGGGSAFTLLQITVP